MSARSLICAGPFAGEDAQLVSEDNCYLRPRMGSLNNSQLGIERGIQIMIQSVDLLMFAGRLISKADWLAGWLALINALPRSIMSDGLRAFICTSAKWRRACLCEK